MTVSKIQRFAVAPWSSPDDANQFGALTISDGAGALRPADPWFDVWRSSAAFAPGLARSLLVASVRDGVRCLLVGFCASSALLPPGHTAALIVLLGRRWRMDRRGVARAAHPAPLCGCYLNQACCSGDAARPGW